MAEGGHRGLRAASTAAVLAAFAGCSLVLDFGAEGGGGLDGGPGDAAAALCDLHEPNGSIESRVAVDDGTYEEALCPSGDVDFFGFTIAEGDGVAAEIQFQGGDLDLRLLSVATGSVVSASTGNTGVERIEHSVELGNALPAGEYALEVLGIAQPSDLPYQLVLSFARVSTPDAGVPDASL